MRLNHPWVVFAALALLYFLVSAGTFSTLGVVLPAMVGELHWTWAQAGRGFALLGVACGLSSVAAAASLRRLGVRTTLLIGGALLCAGFAGLACAAGLTVYLASTILLGIAFSFCTTVPGTYVLTGMFERRSIVVGAYFTVGALGQVAGPLIYVAIAPGGGWRAYWWLLVAASALSAVLAAAVTPDRLEGEAAQRAQPEAADPAQLARALGDFTVRRALGAWQFWVIVGAYTMYLLINTTAHGFAVEHLVERGVSQTAGAAMLSLEALIGAALSLVGGVVGERVRPKALFIVCLASLIVGMTGLAFAHGFALMGVYVVGVGIGYGLSFVATTMLLLSYFGRRAYLEIYSIMCLVSTAAALGPALGGWARDALGGFEGVFLVCAAAALVMLIATAFMRAPQSSPPLAEPL